MLEMKTLKTTSLERAVFWLIEKEWLLWGLANAIR
jgi:hypothetical protein